MARVVPIASRRSPCNNVAARVGNRYSDRRLSSVLTDRNWPSAVESGHRTACPVAVVDEQLHPTYPECLM